MKQVFINLLTNAVQASPAGETVSISSSVDGGKIVINVTDHGYGLTAEQKGNIFTPFFTTRVPVTVGFILTGILAGPHLLGLVKAVHEVEMLADIGVILITLYHWSGLT
jgi:nitrogen-specific signal transduction histidine kinase